MRVLAIFTLLLFTVAPKILLELRPTEVDTGQLNRDIILVLKGAGFQTGVDLQGDGVIAKKGKCRTLIQNGDRGRELKDIFEQQAANFGPVQFGYRDRWKASPAPIRSVIERVTQDGSARIWIFFDRPAVLAVAQSQDCHVVHDLLNRLHVRSHVSMTYAFTDAP